MLRLSFFFLCICLLFSAHSHRVAWALAVKEQGRESVVVNGLLVNGDNSYRSIVYKNEKSGIEDLRNLLKSSRMEECWIYLPFKEKWVEVGRGEAPEKKLDNRYVTKVSIDVQFMEGLMAKNSLLVVYHIHPTYTLLLEDKKKERRERGYLMTVNEGEKERVLFFMKRAFPSEQDLGNMIENSLVFYGENPHGNITFKICSHYGVTEYSLTEKGKSSFVSGNYLECLKKIIQTCYKIKCDMDKAAEVCEQKIRKTINHLYRTQKHSKQKKRRSSRVKKDFSFQVENAVESINADYVKFTFVPY
ncbi:MAG: hypothetical protein GY941_15475 [Planctomycetes bacterium]|nr:hypothetical protein [Planctomycetota bacterium]